MGILSNTVSICQFNVQGNIPDTDDIFEWGSERLEQNGFISIDNTTEELSCGWVHINNPQESSFSVPRDFWRDNYLTFSLRRDQRKIPSILFKTQLQEAETAFLEDHPGYKYVSRQNREDLRDQIRSTLFAKTLPSPAIYDVVWDTRSGLLTLVSLSTKIIELFEEQFTKTFDGMRLQLIHPFVRAMNILDEKGKQELQLKNQDTASDTLSLIKNNGWLGADFLLWLLYMTMNASSEYMMNQPGHFLDKEPFVAFLDERFILTETKDNGRQKVSVSGPQDHFRVVRTALKEEKKITEATIFMEKGDDSWRITLKGDLFQFSSFKCPKVQLEKDEQTNEQDEKEAVFYERMLLLEQGVQMFDSLYRTFLNERLSPAWEDKEKKIKNFG